MKTRFFSPMLILCIYAVLFFSCKDNKNEKQTILKDTINHTQEITQPVTQPVTSHSWFYFTGTNFFQIDIPQNAPQILKKPWTEAVRISSALSIKNNTKNYDVYFTVNRSGLLIAQPDHPKKAIIANDLQLFSKLTAGSLVCVDGFPVFHTYKNSFFAGKEKTIENLPFLVQFHPGTSIFLPLLYTKDLKILSDTQVTDVQYTAGVWIAALKTETEEKTQFEYMNFFSYEPLVQFSPTKRTILLETKNISVSEYRQLLTPTPFSSSPGRLKDLYKRLPNNFPFYATCTLPNGGSAVTYLSGSAENEKTMSSQALLAETFSLAVFSDGTCFFAGALPQKHILSNGSPLAFRLPRLPLGFTYGDIGVCKTTLYVAWEEGSFYETGRSGFLTVDLEQILY